MKKVVKLTKVGYSFAPVFPLLALVFIFSSVSAATGNENFNEYFCHISSTDKKNNEKNNEFINKTSNDLDVISQRGTIRVLLQKKNNNCVISKTEESLIQEFASTYNLKIDWVYVNHEWELVTELMIGNGDIVAGQGQNLTTGLHSQLKFTHAWASTSYKVVQRRDNSRINRIQDLTGRHVVAYKASPVWEYLVELSKTQTGMLLQEIPKNDSYQKALERVKTGQYDLAVVDSIYIDRYLTSDNELQTSLRITEEKNMAWAVRSDAEKLHQSLNQYLNQQHLTHNIASTLIGDLPEIKSRGYLRIITNANPTHYYLNNGNLNGFEYELLEEFASRNQMRVDVVIASSKEEMFKLLKEGRGDVIAASLPTNFLKHNDSIQYTKPYNYASPLVIGRKTDELIIDVRDMVGKRIALSRDHPYWNYISKLRKQGLDFELIEVDTDDVETIMLQIAFGIYDLTIVDSHQVRPNSMTEAGLSTKFILFEPLAHRWALRAESDQLHSALDKFIESEYRGIKYNLLHARYFSHPQEDTSLDKELVKVDSLSPYDDMTKHYSSKYGFDWRLITALMFQESKFNPNANSYSGAKGVMQIIGTTAKLMGLRDTKNVEKSIDAGVRYLSYLRSKFDNSILLHDRMWFAVASYNSGYTRLKRARQLAVEMGLDKNKWFQNVELAMLSMAKPYKKNGKKVRNCRCGQTVVYVRDIRTRYFNYLRLTETQQLASIRFYTNGKKYQFN